MVEWSRLRDLYERIDAQRAQRAQRSLGPKKTKEWSSKWIEYAVEQINGDWLTDTFRGTTRLNLSSSNEHIANVILVQYKHKIHPFMTPFRSSDFVPEAVWQAMIAKVVEMREEATYWIVSEREEMWNRPSSVDVYEVPECLAHTTIRPTIVKRGKIPILRISLGVVK